MDNNKILVVKMYINKIVLFQNKNEVKTKTSPVHKS